MSGTGSGIGKPILPESSEAASIREVKGWVSRRGRFFGDDEESARLDGATHLKCPRCEAVNPRDHALCPSCKNQRLVERVEAMSVGDPNGSPLYSLTLGRYFDASVDVLDHLALEVLDLSGGATAEALTKALKALALVVCDPVRIQIVRAEVLEEDIPESEDGEDAELAKEIREALDHLNAVIRRAEPVGWRPSSRRVPIEPLVAEGLRQAETAG